MRVRDAMTRNVTTVRSGQSIQDAARVMMQMGTGFLPVDENDKLVGTVTDRDIAVRAVAAGKSLDTPVREVMTHEVRYCFDDETLGHVADNMAELKVRRLPVVNREKRLVGVIALGDLTQAAKGAAAKVITGVSIPGGPHDQSIS